MKISAPARLLAFGLCGLLLAGCRSPEGASTGKVSLGDSPGRFDKVLILSNGPDQRMQRRMEGLIASKLPGVEALFGSVVFANMEEYSDYDRVEALAKRRGVDGLVVARLAVVPRVAAQWQPENSSGRLLADASATFNGEPVPAPVAVGGAFEQHETVFEIRLYGVAAGQELWAGQAEFDNAKSIERLLGELATAIRQASGAGRQ